MRRQIYMDYNATAPIRDAVIETVSETMRLNGNPSSVHASGRAARAKVEEARAQVAALAGVRPRDIVFTSGGTEANNTVIRGCGARSLLISAIEHDCGLAAAKTVDIPVTYLPVGPTGIVDMEALEQALQDAPKPALVSVMLANNEMGAIQPLEAIAKLAKVHGALVHTDAVQAAGKIMLDLAGLGVDYLTLSAHKLGGPQGVGAIALAPTAPLKPFIVGGGQELSRRSGTENVAGIAGFGVAALEAMGDMAVMETLAKYRDRLENEITQFSNDAIIVGAGADRLANTSCVVMPGVKGETQVMHFDLNGISLSSGSACSSGKVKVSHVLSAMGFEPAVAECSIRISMGYDTKEEDVEQLIKAWKSLYSRTAGR